jgi:DNA-binding Lrp family transcriptional regulator
MFDVSVLLSELLEKPQSFSDIARKYGVSRQYVSKVAKPLLEAGIIEPCEQGYRVSEKGAIILSLLTKNFRGLSFVKGFNEFVEGYLKLREEENNLIKSMSPEEIGTYYTIRSLYAHLFFNLHIHIMLTAIMQVYAYTVVSRISSEKFLDTLLETLWKASIKPLIKNMLKVLRKYDILEFTEICWLYTQILLTIEKDLQTIQLLTSKIAGIVRELPMKALLALETFDTVRDILAIPDEYLRTLGLEKLLKILEKVLEIREDVIRKAQEIQASK